MEWCALNEWEESVYLPRCSGCCFNAWVKLLLDRTTGVCMCVSVCVWRQNVVWCDSSVMVSQVSQSVRRTTRVQARRRKKKRRGDGRGRQCGFEMRLFLLQFTPTSTKTWCAEDVGEEFLVIWLFSLCFYNPTEQIPLRFDRTKKDMKFPIENPRKQVNWDPEQGW